MVNARLVAQREVRERLRGQNTKEGVDELLDDQILLEVKLRTAESQIAGRDDPGSRILRANSLALASQARLGGHRRY